MCADTVRRWLRKDHYETYLEFWADGDVIVNNLVSSWRPATSPLPVDLPDPDDPRSFDPLEDER